MIQFGQCHSVDLPRHAAVSHALKSIGKIIVQVLGKQSVLHIPKPLSDLEKTSVETIKRTGSPPISRRNIPGD
jgi:hypothetical protein